jgi:murein tripeptide amidase MpaA
MHLQESRAAAVPWPYLAVLASATATALLATASSPTPAPVRSAIRVDCTAAEHCALAEKLAVDVWSNVRGPELPLDVVVWSTDLARLRTAGVTWQVIDRDIDATAAAEHARLARPHAQDGGDWFTEYKDFTAISAKLEQLAALAPDRVQLESIGRSIEGRRLLALRIGGTAADAKPMLIDGTLHAREWIAAMTTTCVADRLVRGYATDPVIRDFVDHTELWVVPVANPDGYQHSWSSNRYWRKNRRGTHGVDLNRNFGVAWGGRGSSGLERSDIYRGTAAFSEPETRALRDLALREQFTTHIDFHSYGQLILYPWAYTSTPAPHKARYAATGDKLASAMAATHGSRYVLQSGADLYAAAGTMSDWMYGEAGVTSYTVELRPNGNRGGGGFVLPPEQIKPTCDEALAAVLALRGSSRH